MLAAIYDEEKFSLTGDGPYCIESEKDHSHETFKLALEMNGYVRFSDRKPHRTGNRRTDRGAMPESDMVRRESSSPVQTYRYKDNRHLYLPIKRNE